MHSVGCRMGCHSDYGFAQTPRGITIMSITITISESIDLMIVKSLINCNNGLNKLDTSNSPKWPNNTTTYKP